ncbi:TraR/DksA C4-type zinc finger protein [Planococcus sp. APC 3906]|uniref:TraR/DksA C4-type zinc finger protein n=1 Tax=Planococcus sp. APC 3906 TaxID=3035194 RepID=UPI0025B51F52|nr:TraR/DksA C4-type zinc finger protein [Planococcus sp. APC 3906]MDN3448861.1 TraR/DksA C4-type zinc finger protein [Planococcus sp. APC 3906]
MTDEQLKQMQAILIEQKNKLEGRIEHKEEFERTELSNYDNHPADNATDLFDQERGMAINQFKQEELDETYDALAAIQTGTYGKCAVCGKDIPFERLEALPTALTCIDHAQHNLDMTTRPPEEDAMGSSTSRPAKKDDSRLRDYDDSFEDVEDFGSSDGPQDQPGKHMDEFYDDEKKQ